MHNSHMPIVLHVAATFLIKLTEGNSDFSQNNTKITYHLSGKNEILLC